MTASAIKSGCSTLDARINNDLRRGVVTSPAVIDFVVASCPCNTCAKYRIAKKKSKERRHGR